MHRNHRPQPFPRQRRGRGKRAVGPSRRIVRHGGEVGEALEEFSFSELGEVEEGFVDGGFFWGWGELGRRVREGEGGREVSYEL